MIMTKPCSFIPSNRPNLSRSSSGLLLLDLGLELDNLEEVISMLLRRPWFHDSSSYLGALLLTLELLLLDLFFNSLAARYMSVGTSCIQDRAH